MLHLFVLKLNKKPFVYKYKITAKTAENKEAKSTAIFVVSSSCKLLEKAKLPIKILIVKPIPVMIATI